MLLTNRFLNHDIYDSLVFSGEIKFLDHKIHQIIQDTFNMIKNHNYYLRLIMDTRGRGGKVSEVVIYYDLLDKYERKLLIKIPDMMAQLEEKFG